MWLVNKMWRIGTVMETIWQCQKGAYLILKQSRDNIGGIVRCLIISRHEMQICIDYDRRRRRLSSMESMPGLQLVMCGAESFARRCGAADAGYMVFACWIRAGGEPEGAADE